MVKNELQAMCPHWVFQEPRGKQEIVGTDLFKALEILQCRIHTLHKMKLDFFSVILCQDFISIKANLAKKNPTQDEYLHFSKCSEKT